MPNSQQSFWTGIQAIGSALLGVRFPIDTTTIGTSACNNRPDLGIQRISPVRAIPDLFTRAVVAVDIILGLTRENCVRIVAESDARGTRKLRTSKLARPRLYLSG